MVQQVLFGYTMGIMNYYGSADSDNCVLIVGVPVVVVVLV